MKILRCISDFGNSMSQHMINGDYFEMPSSISEITAKEADALFTDSVDIKHLKNQLVIKTTIDNEICYFKVGKKAEADIFGNDHISKLHDKTESKTVIVSWLASLAYYHVNQEHLGMLDPTEDSDSGIYNIEIKYFLTMLPIWLIKKSDKFKDKLVQMEQRFQQEHEVQLLTPNFERTICVKVEKAVCRVEGETSRYALKFDLQLAPKDITKYANAYAVICDWGAQTLDLTKLQPELKKPADTNDFASFTDKSYLKSLEDLRTTKLMDYFNDVRSLERFILENIDDGVFEYEDPTTKKKTDFTIVIDAALKDIVKTIVLKAVGTFRFQHGQSVYFIWTGGVSELLKQYIEKALEKVLSKEITSNYHVFPTDSRKLNIYGGEIFAKSELAKMGVIETTSTSLEGQAGDLSNDN